MKPRADHPSTSRSERAVEDAVGATLELSVDDALRIHAPRVDLRSPSEFEEDHLPGAVNVPLFDDAERSIVGTLYKQVGPERAHTQALELTRQNVRYLAAKLAGGIDFDGADLEARVEAIAAGGVPAMEARLAGRAADPASFAAAPAPIVLCCWRGGLRSRAVAALLGGLGLDAAIVRGGYKAYRKRVLDLLASWQAPPSFVLRGLTGVGKTLVLREMERMRPGATVDLELHAGHRSSILGAVGLEPATQKRFDGALGGRLETGFPHGFAVFEGESRKVGDSIVPDRVWEALVRATPFELVVPIERRIEVLLADYLQTPNARESLRPGLAFIESRLGRHKYRGVLTDLLEAGRDAELVEHLLLEYYDPLYRHSEARHTRGEPIDAREPADAAAQLLDRISVC